MRKQHKLKPYYSKDNPNAKWECENCTKRFSKKRHAKFFLCKKGSDYETT